MDALPKEAKQLIRLQILTPISVLLTVAANLVAGLAISPTLGEISDDYLTIFTPTKYWIGAYWLLLYILQIGYCIILATVRKSETKDTILHAIGLRFVLANVCMAFWTLFFSMRQFLVSEIFLLIALALLISCWALCLVYPPNFKSRPMDTIFIHAPIRMFLVMLLVVDVWQNGLLAFRWYKYVGPEPISPSRPGRWEGEHSKHSWIAFGVVLAVGLINAFIVFISRDVVWALSAIFIYIALVIKGPKPAQLFIPIVLLAVLQLVALIASVLYYRYKANRAGEIRLVSDEEEADASPVGSSSHHRSARPSSGNHEDSFVVQGGGPGKRASTEGPREIGEEL